MSRWMFAGVVASTLLLGACASSQPAPGEGGADTATVERNHGYALLYSVIKDESDVDKVLIIKRPSAAVASLVKEIGEFCRGARASLDGLAKEDPPIALEYTGLPAAELQTRSAIDSTTSRQIILHGGKELEFRLLLTQVEALNYVHSLATTLEGREERENRKRFLANVAKESNTFRERALTLAKGPYVGMEKPRSGGGD